MPKCPHCLEYSRPFMGNLANKNLGDGSRILLTCVNDGKVWKDLEHCGGFLGKLVHRIF